MKTELLEMKIKTTLKLLCICALMQLCVSCANNDEEINEQAIAEEEAAIINEELAKLAAFSQPDEIPQPELLNEDKPEKENEFECVVRKYKVAPGYDQMMILNPTSDVIYPGAMLKGESIPTGEYIGINGGRAPITLSISLENIAKASVEIENPGLDGVRNGVNALLSQGITGSTPAKINFTIEEVYSEEHLDIALGLNYSSRKKDVSASFDFESSEYKYKYVVMFLQEYYSIDMNLPPNQEPGSLFTELPNLDGTSPVMVSSVKYGRMVLYTVESNYTTTDVKTAFNMSFNQGKTTGEGEVEVDYNKIISESKIDALVIGGSAEDAVAVIQGPSGVYSYIINGGNYSTESPGAPLAYTLRYIREDFPVARVVLSSEYLARSCDLAYPKFKITIEEISRTGSAEKEIYGNIKARIKYKGNFVDDEASWSKTSKNHVDVSPSDPYTVNKSVTITLYKPDYDEDEVYLSSHLYDKNIVGYDDLGSDNMSISLKKIGFTPVVIKEKGLRDHTHALDSFEDKMKVTFTVERLQ